jgi:hypothetical protein
VVGFTAKPLYPRYPLDRKLGGPQSRSGRCGEEQYRDSNIYQSKLELPINGNAAHFVRKRGTLRQFEPTVKNKLMNVYLSCPQETHEEPGHYEAPFDNSVNYLSRHYPQNKNAILNLSIQDLYMGFSIPFLV